MPVDLQNKTVRNEIKYLGFDLNRRKNYTIENVLPPVAIPTRISAGALLSFFFFITTKTEIEC